MYFQAWFSVSSSMSMSIEFFFFSLQPYVFLFFLPHITTLVINSCSNVGFLGIKAELCFYKVTFANLPGGWRMRITKRDKWKREGTAGMIRHAVCVHVCWRPVYPWLQWHYCSQILRPKNYRLTMSTPTQWHDYCFLLPASTYKTAANSSVAVSDLSWASKQPRLVKTRICNHQKVFTYQEASFRPGVCLASSNSVSSYLYTRTLPAKTWNKQKRVFSASQTENTESILNSLTAAASTHWCTQITTSFIQISAGSSALFVQQIGMALLCCALLDQIQLLETFD